MPVRGEYVTAKIAIKDALLNSPDLSRFRTPMKQTQLPGNSTPEDFPTPYMSPPVLVTYC